MKEEILKTGNANWFHGLGCKGGKLILTSETLYFEGHMFNAGKKEYEVELENIKKVKKGFFKDLVIETTNGREEFVVNGKKNWITAIENAIAQLED